MVQLHYKRSASAWEAVWHHGNASNASPPSAHPNEVDECVKACTHGGEAAPTSCPWQWPSSSSVSLPPCRRWMPRPVCRIQVSQYLRQPSTTGEHGWNPRRNSNGVQGGHR
eukprot:208384-Chlamydomonas_euryale.AAC.7